jgi:hypothetical protein
MVDSFQIDRDDLGITRRLAAGLKCASLLDLPWLFRCFRKDPSSDLAVPVLPEPVFQLFPVSSPNLLSFPYDGVSGEDRAPDLRVTNALRHAGIKFTNAGVAAGNRKSSLPETSLTPH